MIKSIKLAHIIAPVKFGGGESLLFNLVSERVQGLTEEFLLLSKSEYFEKKLSEINICYHRFSNIVKNHDFSKIEILIYGIIISLQIFKLNKYVKKYNINILHIHGFPGSLIGFVLKILNSNIRIIYTHHANRKPTHFDFIFRHIYKKYDYLTSVSVSACNSLNSIFSKKGLFFNPIYNCVGNEFFKTVHKKSKGESNKFKFIQIGRFEIIKNQLLVIECLRKIPKEILDDIEITFIGVGSTLQDAKRLTTLYNLNDKISFMGFVENFRIPEILTQYDFGLFPSDLEGFGIGAVECMACGLPVLAQKNALMEEIIKNYGVLVDKDHFYLGFKEIIEKKYDPQEIMEYAKEFSPSQIKQKYLTVYRRLLNE